MAVVSPPVRFTRLHVALSTRPNPPAAQEPARKTATKTTTLDFIALAATTFRPRFCRGSAYFSPWASLSLMRRKARCALDRF
jgi:hypothetical protein